jgi:hypothetical protein
LYQAGKTTEDAKHAKNNFFNYLDRPRAVLVAAKIGERLPF